ncbi:MAG: ADP-ribosyl-(dinitrogen reductase) glycohydrolase [Pelotomaculum sp. PtaB.Bin104]|nr:MAG: ADP-ribosyl-(dinitrogen reductase) glycohydrolase [Pelotomaculum sp. PtaB.Bin104]
MLGAIVGDIIGSRFEFNNHRSKDFDLFDDGCFATDDSIMTFAVAKAIMEATKVKNPDSQGYDHDFHALLSDLTVKYMQEIGRKYPNCGFGVMFYRWIFSDSPEPYNSFGNGAAMRVSAAGFAAADEWAAEQLAETVTAVTHNHEEGIKGATATAVAIYFARKGATKGEIRERIVRDFYPLDFKINDIRASYHFNETCQETVPQAIECFLESTSFEDAIRTAISLGGDSDTIAAITGAIADAYYGVPDDIKVKALSYLDEELLAIYNDWQEFAPSNDEQFRVLTKYIGKLTDRTMIDDHLVNYMAYFPFTEFEAEWIGSEFAHPQYGEILASMGLELKINQIADQDVSNLDAEQVLALITAAFRHDHFNEGVLVEYFRVGAMLKWLKRLKDIDWQKHPRSITEVELQLGGMGGYDTYRVLITDNKAIFSMDILNYGDSEGSTGEKENIVAIRHALEELHFEYWLSDYPQEGEMLVCDGEQWSLTVKYDDGTELNIGGDNTYPEKWNDLLDFFGIDYEDLEDE